MKFGVVEQPELVDFTLPPDHTDTNGAIEHNFAKAQNIQQITFLIAQAVE